MYSKLSNTTSKCFDFCLSNWHFIVNFFQNNLRNIRKKFPPPLAPIMVGPAGDTKLSAFWNMCFSKPPHFGNRGAAPVCSVFWYVLFYKKLIVLHHGCLIFYSIWHLYQIHTFINNLSDKEMTISHLMCTFYDKNMFEEKKTSRHRKI